MGAGLGEPGALPPQLSSHPGSALWTSPYRRQHLRGFPGEDPGLAPRQPKPLSNRALSPRLAHPPATGPHCSFLEVKASQAAGRPPGKEVAGTQAVYNPAHLPHRAEPFTPPAAFPSGRPVPELLESGRVVWSGAPFPPWPWGQLCHLCSCWGGSVLTPVCRGEWLGAQRYCFRPLLPLEGPLLGQAGRTKGRMSLTGSFLLSLRES